MTETSPAGQTVPAEPVAAGTEGTEAPRPTLMRDLLSGSWLVSVLSIVVGLLAGAVLIAAAEPDVQATLSYFFARPIDFFGAV